MILSSCIPISEHHSLSFQFILTSVSTPTILGVHQQLQAINSASFTLSLAPLVSFLSSLSIVNSTISYYKHSLAPLILLCALHHHSLLTHTCTHAAECGWKEIRNCWPVSSWPPSRPSMLPGNHNTLPSPTPLDSNFTPSPSFSNSQRLPSHPYSQLRPCFPRTLRDHLLPCLVTYQKALPPAC